MTWFRFKLSFMRLRLWKCLGAALACIVFAAACTRPAEEPKLAEGRPFPPLALNLSSGKVLSIKSFQGKVLVLNVWATWCPPCRREMPGLERLSRILDPNRFAVVGISTDKDELLAAEFLMKNGITFANFFDQNGKIARQLGLKVYPETFLIGPDGTLLQRIPGMRDWDSDEMVAQVEAAYHGRQSRPPEKNDSL